MEHQATRYFEAIPRHNDMCLDSETTNRLPDPDAHLPSGRDSTHSVEHHECKLLHDCDSSFIPKVDELPSCAE